MKFVIKTTCFLFLLLFINFFEVVNEKYGSARASETVILEIMVQGAKRIDPETIISFGQFELGERLDDVKLNEIIKRANTRLKIPSSLDQACFKRISDNKLIFIMDCGSPPQKKTHAGSLSFEFSHFGEKLVVNSGSPFVNDKKWIEAMRSTAAHSTVSIDDINSSDIFYQKDTISRIASLAPSNLVVLPPPYCACQAVSLSVVLN